MKIQECSKILNKKGPVPSTKLGLKYPKLKKNDSKVANQYKSILLYHDYCQ